MAATENITPAQVARLDEMGYTEEAAGKFMHHLQSHPREAFERELDQRGAPDWARGLVLLAHDAANASGTNFKTCLEAWEKVQVAALIRSDLSDNHLALLGLVDSVVETCRTEGALH